MDCPDCAAYEAAVMARAPEGPVPEPCGHYEMSDAFQEWLVGRMRNEVQGEIQTRGLDRLGILKGRTP